MSVGTLPALSHRPSTNDLLRTETGNVFLPQALEQFTYDVDGNLLTDGRWTYAWDGENRLVSLTANTNVPTAARLKVELGYDVQGRRTSKKVSAWNGSSYVAQSTNRCVYDGWNLLGELDVPSGTLVRSYVWGTDLSGTTQGAGGVGGLLMSVVHTGAEAGAYFAAYDGNGNVVGLIRSSDGLARAEYEYGPFGEVIRASGPIAKTNPFRFSTKFQDDESDLLYYGYRYYNASTGRWLSRDPAGERESENLYAFLANEPIGSIDILGLQGYISDSPYKAAIRNSGAGLLSPLPNLDTIVQPYADRAGPLFSVQRNPSPIYDPTVNKLVFPSAADIDRIVVREPMFIAEAPLPPIPFISTIEAARKYLNQAAREQDPVTKGLYRAQAAALIATLPLDVLLARGMAKIPPCKPAAKNAFPKNPADLLPDMPRNAKGYIEPNQYTRIRPEQHALKPGETYAPRHHGQHYHVETRIDPTKSWNNPNNVIKVKPPGYVPGEGTGFLPGEKFPGAP